MGCRRRPLRRLVVTAILSAAACLSWPTDASAQDPDATFFHGKTITYVVAAAAGGGYDTYGRLLARYLEKHLPGTRVIIRNVPGAGHIVGANTTYIARPDGLTLGTFVTGLIYAQLLEQNGVRFDLAEMSWIGALSEEGRSLVLSKNSGLESVEDLFAAREPVLLATSGIGASNHIESRIMIYALDLNARLVPNMQAAETEMSMIRSEIAGVLGGASSLDEFVRQGHGKFVLSIAGERSVLPGVPQANQFIKREDARALMELVETMAELGRVTAGPPGIPLGRLAILRRAFDAAAADPDLLADARRLHLPIDPSSGEDVEAIVKILLDQPPETVALLRRTGADQ